MKAVRCHRYAGLDADGRPVPTPGPLRDVLSLDEIPQPECSDGQVLIRTHYAGVQYPDALQAQGLYQHKPSLPYVPGMDVAGTVMQAGAGADHVAVGDRVIAQMSLGGLAEAVVVPASSVWKTPGDIDLSKCANLGRNFFPAYHSLKVLGDVKAGDLVLVDGASGGVGMAAVELAKAMGAQVIAGVSI
ncbi:MAG: alcohol dehydrogenase catalytic domain-containing protein, partial [Vicinamibacterales bacterium]|nr:alcohol dehydrogenase catalytic domain-containing protein [Vicinamibacterales bacterium]